MWEVLNFFLLLPCVVYMYIVILFILGLHGQIFESAEISWAKFLLLLPEPKKLKIN
jgi:hypothetical protein